ncbi:putative ABC iron siderophore transporter [Brachybacterium sp. SW0106-09]|uniref:dynamin family protein n=1 Tax=Brachybacterium sp. SW0106-09 TaxID=1704590 RepID=UPI0006B5BD8D|nr:dynamin family protein [Brachybacterium sp. SW0106-09]GAP80446.1 putative ABC iron siderophore transporter [Brachybacterium sp. SW0106-09]
MSLRRPRTTPLHERLDALDRALAALDGIAPGEALTGTAELLERIDRRRALSAEHTVIGLFGATGSGKSSLLNALIGKDVARAAVRRPTTSAPLAAVLGDAGSEALLDWLEVEERHALDEGTALARAASKPARGRRARRTEAGTPGVVLLDLPDLDSVESAHRDIAERMTGMVDVIVWVTDPQKYADALLHHEFVRPFAGHDAVTVLVLNQVDRLREAEREGVLASLAAIARADGLESAPVLAASAETGEGIEELREHLLGIARSREAVVERHRADVRGAAARLREAADPTGMAERSSPAAIDTLVEDLSLAARVEPVARAVGGSYRHRAARRVGWPPLRWIRSVRADPLARLGIGRGRDGEGLERTSLPAPDAAASARASGGVRRFADDASAGGSDPWRAAVRAAARSEEEALPDALDQAVAEADLRAGETSWWWRVLDVLQWLALLIGVVGLGWLGLNAALAFLGVPPPPMPMVEELWIPIPLPTVMLVLAIAAGILLGVAGSAIAAMSGAWHRRRARRLLTARVRGTAQDLVVEPVDETLHQARQAASDLALAHGE